MIKSFFERIVADIHEVTLETEVTIISAEVIYKHMSDAEKEQVKEAYKELVKKYHPDIIHVHSRTPAWVLHWALRTVRSAVP